MSEFYESLSALERVYFMAAAVGGSVFLVTFGIRMLMGGLDFDGDGDVELDGHGHIELDAHGHGDLGAHGHVDLDTHVDAGGDADIDGASGDLSFKFLSIQGLTAFFLIFGLSGLMFTRDLGVFGLGSLAGSLVSGGIVVWLMKKIFDTFLKFRSSGTVNLNNALSEEGQVYLMIPEDGVGQVQLIVQGRHRTVDAISHDGTEIPTGKMIKVVDIIEANRLVVEEITSPK